MSGDKETVAPDAKRTPGYPLFLSLFVDSRPNGHIINRILLSQLMLSTLTLFIAFLFFKKYLSFYASIGATLMTALCPHLIVMNSYILTETLFCFMIMVLSLQMGRAIEKPSDRAFLLTGMLTAFASLVRPSLFLFLPFIVLFLIYHYWKNKSIRYSIVLIIGFILVISPWMIRNIRTLNQVSDKTLMKNFLYHGMYPEFKFNEKTESYGFPHRFDPKANETSRNLQTILQEIKKRFAQQPLRYLKWYLLKKPVAFWSWQNVQGRDIFIYTAVKSPYYSRGLFKFTYTFMKAFHWILIVLGGIGMMGVWTPIKTTYVNQQQLLLARFCSLLLFYFIIIHIIGFPAPRYSIPLRPFMYSMAMFAIFTTYTFLKNQLRRSDKMIRDPYVVYDS